MIKQILTNEKYTIQFKKFETQSRKIDVYKLLPVLVDFNKLSDVIKNDIVKKDIYNKIPNITNLASNTTLNAKVNEVKNEISSIINLPKKASLNVKIK